MESIHIENVDNCANVVITIDNTRIVLACEDSDNATELKEQLEKCSWVTVDQIGFSA